MDGSYNTESSMRFLLLHLLLIAPLVIAEPVRMPTPGGAVVAADAADNELLVNNWHFAPARVEGNLIYLSGVVAAAREGRPLDVAGFEAALRRAFGQIARTLDAAGSDGANIIDMNTYHVFGSPLQQFDKAAHISAVRRVRDEFVKPPYPAWTAIGVADLFPQGGLVEIRITARKKS
jgi:enamine deaminase RidA (YjgF/YER057c/UK114 family)